MKIAPFAMLAAMLAIAPAHAGTKSIVNNTSGRIKVTVVSRSGNGCTNNGPKASVTVAAGQTR